MKTIIFISILFLIGCKQENPPSKDPHWKYKQHVKYDVPEFYSLVCDGNGIVLNKSIANDWVYYTVEPISTSKKYDCFNTNNTFSVIFKRD